MSEVTETVAVPKRNKNIMPTPRVCVVTGLEYTLYSQMVWLSVKDKETGKYKDVPTHLSKEGAWQLSKQSPTHPSNNPANKGLTVSSAVKAAVSTPAQQGVEVDVLEGILPQE
tara:strand:- start:917 stop:1255 length:339 start_codon:yes stop_codon:yes gene_type:complete